MQDEINIYPLLIIEGTIVGYLVRILKEDEFYNIVVSRDFFKKLRVVPCCEKKNRCRVFKRRIRGGSGQNNFGRSYFIGET